MADMDFISSKADPDVWMRPTEDGKAYEYITVYIDNLAIATTYLTEICPSQKVGHFKAPC